MFEPGRLLVVALLLFLMAGCGGRDFVYQPENETKPGPGLFSGDDGVFKVVGSQQEKPAPTKEVPPVE